MKGISNRKVLIWLNSLGIGNRNIDKLMKQIPQLTDIWWASSEQLYSLKGIKSKIIEKIIHYRNNDYINKLFFMNEEQNIRVTTVLDVDYPKRLYHIYDNPKVIYSRGEWSEEDDLSIAVVGSRKATNYGKWATEKIVKELVDLDVTIVSGLALGIDAIAHKVALEENGRTIGILGNGLDIVYPKQNEGLYEEIPRKGAIITEYFLGIPPLAHNFPQRNRMISGLSLGVLVIEAKERSGSLITAHHALEQGKEVFALPGNINSIFSRGTNKLIKDGAKLVMDIDDIIEEIYELQDKIHSQKKEGIDLSGLSPLEVQIMEIVQEGPTHRDAITIKTGVDISTVNSVLTILELKGMIKEMTGGIFTLS